MRQISEIVAENLKSLRANRGWNQEKLAEEATLSVDMIRHLETQRAWLSRDSVASLAKAFGIEEWVLFYDQAGSPPVTIKKALSVLMDELGVQLPKGALLKAQVEKKSNIPSDLEEAMKLVEKIGIGTSMRILSHRARGEPVPEVKEFVDELEAEIGTLKKEMRRLNAVNADLLKQVNSNKNSSKSRQ